MTVMPWMAAASLACPGRTARTTCAGCRLLPSPYGRRGAEAAAGALRDQRWLLPSSLRENPPAPDGVRSWHGLRTGGLGREATRSNTGPALFLHPQSLANLLAVADGSLLQWYLQRFAPKDPNWPPEKIYLSFL